MAHDPNRLAYNRGRELAAHAEALNLDHVAELEMRNMVICHVNVDASRGVLYGDARPIGLSERNDSPQPNRVAAIIVSACSALDLGGRGQHGQSGRGVGRLRRRLPGGAGQWCGPSGLDVADTSN